ncbi:MAG: phosphoribosylanthranilate isomerase [Pseudohongiellaceae bacterium]|mgnify:CR=1 FL=1|jgi:phosphoribosylanthranilate isomerase
MRVKVCGITSVDDAIMAVKAGADAIGLVFYEPSPRCVSVEQAEAIARAVGPFVTVVALFVNAPSDVIADILKRVPIHVIQFHGDEPAEFCEQFSRPYMKALRMREDLDVHAAIAHFDSALGILLDAYTPGVPGGTGETFDWQRVPKDSSRAIILAGGLTPENIRRAVAETSIYGVDVSGGVERAPGIKEAQKIESFVRAAKSFS